MQEVPGQLARYDQARWDSSWRDVGTQVTARTCFCRGAAAQIDGEPAAHRGIFWNDKHYGSGVGCAIGTRETKWGSFTMVATRYDCLLFPTSILMEVLSMRPQPQER